MDPEEPSAFTADLEKSKLKKQDETADQLELLEQGRFIGNKY